MAEWVLAGAAIFGQVVIGLFFVAKISAAVEKLEAVVNERHQDILRRLSRLEGMR